MHYGEIIKDSWHLTVENPRIKWLVLIPSFFAVLIFTIEVAWQAYLYADKYDLMGFTATEGYAMLLQFITENSLWGISIVVILLLVLFMFVVPLWVQGTLILCVRHKLLSPEVPFMLRTKMLKGIEYFFPFFKFEAATSIFSLLSIIFFALAIHRYFESLFHFAWPIILVYALIAMVVNLFLSFAPFYIVTENLGTGAAIKKSAKLVFTHLGETFTITMLMFLVNLRLLFNALVILGVPLAVVAAFTIFNSSTATILSVLVIIVAVAIAAYLAALMVVFMTTVWCTAFEVLKVEHEKIIAVDESVE
jgi:hypothetical protein